MKIAIVHDYLKEMGGAERVLTALSQMYPKAPIYTAFVDPNSAASRTFHGKIVESSWGWILKLGKMYSYLRFCLPWVWKSLDLSQYDLVITSCSGYIARGFKVGEKTTVVAYCHTPPRWLYGYETPTGAQGVWWGKVYLWIVGPFVRYFDYMSAQRVDKWIANSQEVASRIRKFYRKEAVVVYPPCEISESQSISRSAGQITRVSVDQPSYAKASDGKQYWLIVSRIVGGKGIREAIDAVKRTGDRLKIVGTGQQMKVLQRHSATVPQVEWLGYIADENMSEIYANAKGFLALAKDEDFGMSVVEAMANGVPVLAYNGGGFCETVIEGVNGRLITGDVSAAMKTWGNKWDKSKIVASVSKYGRERFEKEIRKIVEGS